MNSGIIEVIKENQKIEQEWDESEKNNPPEKMDVDKITLKKEGEAITIATFEKYMAKIGWSLSFRGCEHYAMLNHKGQQTNLMLWKYDNDNIEMGLTWNELMFGCNYGGIFKVFLKDAEIAINNMGYIRLTWNQFTLHLANHDKYLSESEEYLRSQPRDFQGRLFCCECKALQTVTHKRSALYIDLNSFSISFSRGFGSPKKCAKCGYSSFGDMNVHTDLKYYSVKTNRVVKMKKIGKIAKEQKVGYDKLIEKEREAEKNMKEKKIAEEENKIKREIGFVKNIQNIGINVK